MSMKDDENQEKEFDPKVKKFKKLKEEDLADLDVQDAVEMNYYSNSVIIKVNENDKLIDDIATCFSIEDTMEYLMLAPLDFISRTDGIENEKEYKEQLWRQVRNFYRAARELLDRRYRI